jgi:hypothetical protein
MGLFERCADQLIAKSAERRVSFKAAIDLVDQSLLRSAFQEYAHRPQICVGGGFASGGQQIRSGLGSMRRVLDLPKFLADVEQYRDRRAVA